MRQPQASPTLRETRDRHAEVLGKALELFSQHGFAQVSMRDLGTCLGIRAGSLYHHIESKDALLQELIEDLYSELLAVAGLVKSRARTPLSRLHGLVDAHIDLHQSMAAHFQVAEYDFHYLDEAYRDSILSLRQRYEEQFMPALEQVTRCSDGPVLRSVAKGMVSLLNQLPNRLYAPQLSDEARRTLLREMALGALHGAMDATPSPRGAERQGNSADFF